MSRRSPSVLALCCHQSLTVSLPLLCHFLKTPGLFLHAGADHCRKTGFRTLHLFLATRCEAQSPEAGLSHPLPSSWTLGGLRDVEQHLPFGTPLGDNGNRPRWKPQVTTEHWKRGGYDKEMEFPVPSIFVPLKVHLNSCTHLVAAILASTDPVKAKSPAPCGSPTPTTLVTL